MVGSIFFTYFDYFQIILKQNGDKAFLLAGTAEQTRGYNFCYKGKKKKQNFSLSNQVHNSPLCNFIVLKESLVKQGDLFIIFSWAIC